MAALTAVLGACSSPRPDNAANSAACSDLSKVLTDQQQTLLVRAQKIRAEHILLLDYDRQMIAVINEGRAAVQATKLTELSVVDEVAGCSGQKLDDLRHRAQDEMSNLRDFLMSFNRALRNDPGGVFIDAP